MLGTTQVGDSSCTKLMYSTKAHTIINIVNEEAQSCTCTNTTHRSTPIPVPQLNDYGSLTATQFLTRERKKIPAVGPLEMGAG